MWRMYAPHKVKFAVSGCPRNCAEAGIKDVGIIGVDSGWEMHIAGNGGIKTEVAHFFTKLKTAEEVLEISGAFLRAVPPGRLVPGAHRALRGTAWAWTTSQKRILEDPARPPGAVGAAASLRWTASPTPGSRSTRAHVDARQFVPLGA